MKTEIRRIVPLFFVPAVLLAQTPPDKSTPEGLALLHKMQSALGGAEKIAAIRDFQETIHGDTWLPDGSPLGKVQKRTRWLKSANVLRLDQTGFRDTYVLYYDGNSGKGWEILPDMTNPDPARTSGKAIDLAGGELEFAQGYLSGFSINLWLADRIPGFAVFAPRPNVLRITHDGKADDVTLDPSSGMPIKTNGVSLANPDEPVRSEMRYEAWTTVSGVRFPTRRANYHDGLKLGEITDAVIQVNTGLKKSVLAAQPADFAPKIIDH